MALLLHVSLLCSQTLQCCTPDFLSFFVGHPVHCSTAHQISPDFRKKSDIWRICVKSQNNIYILYSWMKLRKSWIFFYCKLCLIEFLFVLSARELVSCALAYVNNSNIVLSKLNCCQSTRKSALPNQKFSLCVCLSF